MIGKDQEASHHSIKEEKMKIRLSKEEDLKAIMEIYDLARKFMKEQGNPTQWGEDYPSKLLIEADISSHQSFVRQRLMERSIVSLQTAKSKV